METIQKVPDWDALMTALESWRKKLKEEQSRSGEETSPAVTTVAEQYKRDPWAILASTLLSLRTKDEVTLVAAQALLAKASTMTELLALPEHEIARLIYPVGFYRTKAWNLKRIAGIITEQYGGQVPADMDALLSLPGVGRKTANLVLTEAFDQDGICVDTHVHRISNRTGWVSSATPEQTEQALRDALPRKYWKTINSLLVLYGQRICRPISPFCSQCVIAEPCEHRGVERSR